MTKHIEILSYIAHNYYRDFGYNTERLGCIIWNKLELLMVRKKTYNFIDLFAGCGGLSEGFYRQGFKAVAHVEINHYACETLKERMKFYGYQNYDKEVIEKDITSPDILNTIDDVVAGRQVDIIIGGPPCQAYSTAGRVRDKKGMEKRPA